MSDNGTAAATALAALVARLEPHADRRRVIADVAALADGPRGRHHPAAMDRARADVSAQLGVAGWKVTQAPFQRRWVLGVSDAGGRTMMLCRLRLHRRLSGVNLLAEPAQRPPGPTVLLIAHLDSVAISPGADDNASGVAALLESARLLAGLPQPPAVRLALVDLEEVGRIGSAALAADPGFVRDLAAVICLESVGTFSTHPQSQRLGGLGLLFRCLARDVRANQHRGDFVLAVARRSSADRARALVAAGAALSVPLSLHAAVDPRPDGRRGQLMTALFPFLGNLDRSDHAPFWNRGVPALMLTTTAPFRCTVTRASMCRFAA
jgi:hypothetical protein